jgi:hypothetical protein
LLFASVLFQRFPIVNKIDHFISPKIMLQREFKNYLALSRKLLETPIHGVSLLGLARKL